MPRLCPDLSATVYGGRIALAHMATALGKGDEASRWHDDAEKIRNLIITKLYSPEDAAFYDLDAQNKFVRVRGDLISRVLGEHVLRRYDAHDEAIFDAVWTRQLHNPKAFWATYPLTSIAMDDPTFVRPIPRNSWGGASQALTALRAPRWMALLRQARRTQPPHAAMVLRPHAPHARGEDPRRAVKVVPPADGPPHRRIHRIRPTERAARRPGGPRRLLPLRPHLSRLRPPPQQRLIASN